MTEGSLKYEKLCIYGMIFVLSFTLVLCIYKYEMKSLDIKRYDPVVVDSPKEAISKIVEKQTKSKTPW